MVAQAVLFYAPFAGGPSLSYAPWERIHYCAILAAADNTDDTIGSGRNMAAIRQGATRIGAGKCRVARVS